MIIPDLFLNLRLNYYDEIEAKHGNPDIQEVITIPSYTKVNSTLTYKGLKYNGVGITTSITVRNLTGGEFYQPNVRTGGPKQFMQPGAQLLAKVIFSY